MPRNPQNVGEDWQCWPEDPPGWMWSLEWEWLCWKLSPKTSTEWFNHKPHWQILGKAQKSSDFSLNFTISDLNHPWAAGLNFPLLKGRAGTVWDQFGRFQHP